MLTAIALVMPPTKLTRRHSHESFTMPRFRRRYGGRCLSFFSLDDDPRENYGSDLAFMLLDGIVQMLGQAPAWSYLPVGTQVVHPRRGVGVIEEKHDDGLTLRFSTVQADGFSHRCCSHTPWSDVPRFVEGTNLPAVKRCPATPRLVPSPRYRGESARKLKFDVDLAAKYFRVAQERNTMTLKTSLLLRKALALTVDWNVPGLTKKVLALISEASSASGVNSGPNAELENALHRALRAKKEAVVGMLINYPVRVPPARVVLESRSEHLDRPQLAYICAIHILRFA